MKIVVAFSAALAILLTGHGAAPSLGAPSHDPRDGQQRRAYLLGAPASSRHEVATTRIAGSGFRGLYQGRLEAGASSGRGASQRAVGAPSRTATPVHTGRRAARTPVGTATPSVGRTPTARARRASAVPTKEATAVTAHGAPRHQPSPRAHKKKARGAPKAIGLSQAQYGASHRPYSWLAETTLLTIYGRAFSTAPILGRLGMDDNFAQMEWQIQPYAQGIKQNNGGVDPRVTVHLIYAMAVPCAQTGNCLYYLDDAGADIVKDYIKEAARRHWLVVLDDQLGLSDPVTEVKRMIAKGYLRYDNVEVALDPEFRAIPGQPTPGIPIGTVTAAELNAAGAMINAYAARHNLLHRKVMMVHQFRQDMITDRRTLRQDLFYVDTVVIADGFGPPGLKAHIYSELLGPNVSPGVRWRGIKLFPFNPYEGAGHGDYPEMAWPQVFGHAVAVDTDGIGYFVRPLPNVVVIA